MKRCINFKKFMEDDFIRMNYVCLCVVILVSLAIGFFLYGLAIDCLTAFIGMIIVFICDVLKITVDVNMVSMFSDIISYCKFRFIGSPIPLATDQCFRL